ncbi:FolM Alternative dihydrofolate reductase 1 [hydrothermal vent metagenome]|uniref:FolM Alternative dihydrofolate reductase 1 n=1 Tax=hydrothermal vent metagenome TaxID=652676 RepID=A0A3B1A4Z7_9ZZZZ
MDNTTEANNGPLSGRVVLITGGAHRIGAHTARTLHAEGANLVLHYRSSRNAAHTLQSELNQNRADSVVLICADLLDEATLPALISDAYSAWKRLDVLVNNASTFYPTPIGKATPQQWEDLFGSNLKAPFFLAQAAAPHLKIRRGCIVNIVDIHADRPLKRHPIYSTAKAGLVMLTKALACELGPEIRVNAVAPGAILWPETDMDEVTKQRIINRTFLKRQGSPEHIARAVLYLIRDAEYTSGQVLTVDGGRSLNS